MLLSGWVKKIILLNIVMLSACGSGGKSNTAHSVNSSSQSLTSSSIASSSSVAAITDATVEFVYPTQKAHLGGATSVKIALKVVDIKDRDASAATTVSVGGVALSKQGDMWVSTTNLQVTSIDGQAFPVLVDGLTANTLVLNNLGGTTGTNAGDTPVYAVRSLAFDTDSNTLYFSNPFDAQVMKFNNITAQSEVIYQGTLSTKGAEQIYWPIAVDSENNTVYVSADSYDYSATVGTEKYTVNLFKVTDTVPVVSTRYDDTNGVIKSTRGLIADMKSIAPMSGTNVDTRYPTLYSLDYAGAQPLQRWSVRPTSVRVTPQGITSADNNSVISAAYGLLAITAHLDPTRSSFLVAREHATTEGRGEPSLVEIISTADEDGVYATSTRLTSLSGITKPTALAYTADGSEVYIADSDRIWKMNLTTFDKTLISSTNLIPGKIGTGPSLGSNITAMALHPTLNYLYLAADTNGVIMVDLETGNRITIIK
ncbi:MAG: hypothetical protein U5M23_01875 [Marinagarivorans sp.]|nr:hypothetical protein [Marinagarivorans sp.]